MFCENCGSELRDNAAFCPKCGTAITTETDPVKSTKTHSSPDYRDGYTNHTEDEVQHKQYGIIHATIVFTIVN